MYLLSAEPEWLELLPGVRVKFAPVSRAAYRAARRAAAEVLQRNAEDTQAAADAFSAALIEAGIEAWEGIGDAKGKPLAVTPESKAAFVKDARLFDAADANYVGPFVTRDAEKNGSSLSPGGTSAGAIRARRTARTAPASAKSAPTSSTRRKAPKAKPSGK